MIKCKHALFGNGVFEMRRDKEMRQIALRVSIALAAGMLSIVPVTYGAPVGGKVVTTTTDSSGATVPSATITTSGTTTKIDGKITNNVIDWQDFSVAKGETVLFDNGAKTNNYMNIVSGANTSQINGAIKGGNEVYIINPNGVIFGETASVDVGSLYASTRYVSSEAAVAAATAGDMTTVLADTSAGVATDVVNLGTINATNVVMEGQNVRFVNDSTKTNDGGTNVAAYQTTGVTANAVVLKTDTTDGGYIHVGNADGSDNGYIGQSLITAADENIEYYKLVDSDNWSEINSFPNANYMLKEDIDASNGFTIISSTFTGKLDGNGYGVKNLTSSQGVFSHINSGEIFNFGVKNSTIYNSSDSDDVFTGAIANKAINTIFSRVYSDGTTVTGANSYNVGSLIGYADSVTIDNSYSNGDTNGGGIFAQGFGSGTITVKNSYHKGNQSELDDSLSGIFNFSYADVDISNSYTEASGFFSDANSGVTVDIKNSVAINADGESNYYNAGGISGTLAKTTSYDSISVYKNTIGISNISNTGGVTINESTGAVTRPTWRIYEGQSTPVLTSQLKGITTVSYDYTHGSQSGVNYATQTDSNGNSYKVGADLTATSPVTITNTDGTTSDGVLTYNGSYMNVDEDSLSFGGNADASLVSYSESGTTGVRNAKTKALFYSAQNGYDIVGGNVTMAKRQVTVEGTDLDFSHVYDGEKDVTEEFKTAFSASAGTGTAGGILTDDAAYVTIGYSSDFSAQFTDKNVENDKTINLTGALTLETQKDSSGKAVSGAADILDNYVLADSSSDLSNTTVKGSITARPIYLTVTEPTDDRLNKTYDGTNAVNSTVSASDIFSLDDDPTYAKGTQNPGYGKITGDTVTLKVGTSTPVYVDVDDAGTVTTDDAANAGTHKILFSGIELDGDDAGNYKLQYSDTHNDVTASQVFLDGVIRPRLLASDGFQVKTQTGTDATGNPIYATTAASKVYDGKSSYTVPDNAVLVANTAGTDSNTGVIAADTNNLWFELSSGSVSHFVDSSGEETDMAAGDKAAVNVAYAVDVATADGYDYLKGNYTFDEDTADGTATTWKTLNDAIPAVTGEGTISRRAITVAADGVTGIDKPYDGNAKVVGTGYTTMGGQYLKYAADTTAKLLADDNSATATDTASWDITASYSDKNVARNADNSVANKTVNFTVAITGDDAVNYTLNGVNAENASVTLTGTGKITPLDVTPVFTAISKTYNGTNKINDSDATSVTLASVGSVTGLTYEDTNGDSVTDDVSLAFSSGHSESDAYYVSEDYNGNAGENLAVYYPYLTLAGDDKGNYNLSTTTGTGTGTINRRLILSDSFTVDGSEATKVYDGNEYYTLPDGATLTSAAGESGNTGVITADQPHLHFSLSDTANSTYFTKADGTTHAKTVADAEKISYAVNAAADNGYEYLLGNYKLGTVDSATNLDDASTGLSVSGDGHITRRELTITAENATGIDKPYDTTDTVLADYTGIGNKVKYADGSPELVSSDGTAWNINASYNSADVYRDDSGQVVENGKEVTFNAYLSGDAANNYTINGTDAETYTQASPYELAQKGKGKINPLTITPVFKKITKTYTGTEAITDGNAYIKINDTDTVNVSDFTDNDSRLYTLPENLDGTNVTLKYSTDVENAFYDGAGYGAHTITYKGLSLEGTKSGNYELSSTTITGAGQINKATIGMSDLKFTFADVEREYNGDTAVGDNASDFVTDAYIDFGDGNNAVKFTYTGIDSAMYSSAGVGTGKSVTYTISGITVPDSVLANFEWDSNDPFTSTQSYTEDGVGTITPKTVYATINNPTVTKTYNASDDVQINGSPVTGAALVNITGLVGGSQNTSTAVYTDVNHGKDKDVKYTISVSDGENYNIYYNSADTNADSYTMGYAAEGSSVISTVTTPNNVINQRDLKMTFNPVTKVYDGYTAYGNSTVVNGGAAYSFDDLQGSDALTVADGYTANANYDSPNASTATTVRGATTVTYDKLTINGNEAGNYRLLDKDGNVLAADAEGKYTTTGVGTISKYTLTSAPTINFYHVNKEYDGTSDVVYSRTASENDPRKFINATVTTGSGTEALGFDLVSAVYTGGSAVNSDDGQTIRAGGTQNPAEFKIKFSTENYTFIQGVMGSDFTQLADGSYQYSATYDNATITPRTITVTLGDTLADTTNHYVTKTYNGGVDVQQSITRNLFNFGADDVLTKTDGTLDNVYLANAVQAVYDDKNAGDNKDVTYKLALAGDDAANYKLNTTTLTGKGDIQKAALTIAFDYVEKTYDGNANVTTLTADKVHLTGVQKADGTYETINVDNAIWDGTGDSTNKIIGTYDSPNVQWQVGTDEEAYQGVTYSNLQNALESMTDGDGLAISTNYTIADTKYFAAAKEKGRIMAIAITQNATRNWTPVTREYNADDNVDGVVYAYDPVTGTKGDTLLNTNDILKLTVNKDGNDITVDYTATANFNDKNVGDNKTLNYTIESVDKKVKDGDGNRNYKLSNDVYNELLNDPDGKNISDTNNQITKRQLNAVVQQDSNITKVYDGTKNASADNFVLDEEDRKVMEKDGYNVAEVIQKTAAYRDENATISPGEANTNSLTIDYTMTTTADAQNYEVSTPSAVATGDIVRRTISLNATPVSVNVGESMPGFTGTITGFVGSEAGSYSDFINGVTFKAADGATTSTPGSYGVYGWYMGSKSGILGNYIFDQAAANATAFTVNYVNNDTGNPDTRITPNNDIYHQISKDMSSGFGDTGVAAIEYKDKSGNVIASETIDSGEIHGTGLEISSGASDMSKQADSNANIGIAGSEIVNMDGANAAGSVSIESTGEGTVVNLEVFSIDGDTQNGDNNAAAEITNAADKTNSLEVDNTTDTAGTSGSIAITNEKQNIIGEELEDKEEEQEKEGEIAIKSSNGEDEDEIELTVEDEGVNVA